MKNKVVLTKKQLRIRIKEGTLPEEEIQIVEFCEEIYKRIQPRLSVSLKGNIVMKDNKLVVGLSRNGGPKRGRKTLITFDSSELDNPVKTDEHGIIAGIV